MRICLPAILLLVVASPVRGQSPCQLTGVWELVSGKVDGQPYPTGLHQRKFITRSHWAWVLRQDTDLKDLKTVADTLAAYRTRAGGSGTYTVQGTTYTEKIESFPEPAYEGLAVPFTCRVEGDRFYQAGTFPIMRDGKKVRDQMLEEVYRRVE